MRIEIDDLFRPVVRELLSEHLANMYELSPPKQVFALDLSKLQSPDISFWTVWDNDQLLGCGALKELTSTHGEIKSMRTPARLRGRGAGRAVLNRIVKTAKQRRRLQKEVTALVANSQLLSGSVEFWPQISVELHAESCFPKTSM